jgi:hypothetical protein
MLNQLTRAARENGAYLEVTSRRECENVCGFSGYVKFEREDRKGYRRKAAFYFDIEDDFFTRTDGRPLAVQSYTSCRKRYPMKDAAKVLRRRLQEFERRIGLRVSRAAPSLGASEYRTAVGHSSACAVVSLAAVAGCTHEDAHAFWNLYGARDRRDQGTYTLLGLSEADPEGAYSGKHPGTFNLDLLGIRLVKIQSGPRTAAKFLDEWRNRGDLFFQTRDHVAAVVDGKVIDTGALRPGSRVINAWTVMRPVQCKGDAKEMQNDC